MHDLGRCSIVQVVSILLDNPCFEREEPSFIFLRFATGLRKTNIHVNAISSLQQPPLYVYKTSNASIMVPRLALYGAASTTLAAAVIGSALKTRANFFAAAVTVGRSSGSLMVSRFKFVGVCLQVGVGELRSVQCDLFWDTCEEGIFRSIETDRI